MKIYSGRKVDYAKTNFIRHNIDVFAEAIMKEPMKGGHTHNHLRNALERKLNKSKASRNRCHNYLNRQGF